MAQSKKDLGRALHERIMEAFCDFAREHGAMDADVVIGAFLSGAVQSIALCPCVEVRKLLVEKCIAQILEHSDVPLAAIVTDSLAQAADAMLAAAEPQGRA